MIKGVLHILYGPIGLKQQLSVVDFLISTSTRREEKLIRKLRDGHFASFILRFNWGQSNLGFVLEGDINYNWGYRESDYLLVVLCSLLSSFSIVWEVSTLFLWSISHFILCARGLQLRTRWTELSALPHDSINHLCIRILKCQLIWDRIHTYLTHLFL